MSNPNPSPATRFQPRVSGFEGRQHRYAYYRAMVEDLIPTAGLVLEDALAHGTTKEKIAAAKVVLEYGLGKPVAARVELDQDGKEKGVTVTIEGIEIYTPTKKKPEDERKVEGS